MDEIDTIKHAKQYIDKMANGINPITDLPAEDSDTINNVRVSRCLFYVSGLLDRLVEEPAPKKKPRRSRDDFYITDEQLKSLTPADGRVTVSDIAYLINQATEDNGTRKLAAAWINDWLLSIGLLETVDDSKIPTENGKGIGIIAEKRNSLQRGDYFISTYSKDAQTFIFDNAEAIVEYHYSGKPDKE